MRHSVNSTRRYFVPIRLFAAFVGWPPPALHTKVQARSYGRSRRPDAGGGCWPPGGWRGNLTPRSTGLIDLLVPYVI